MRKRFLLLMGLVSYIARPASNNVAVAVFLTQWFGYLVWHVVPNYGSFPVWHSVSTIVNVNKGFVLHHGLAFQQSCLRVF